MLRKYIDYSFKRHISLSNLRRDTNIKTNNENETKSLQDVKIQNIVPYGVKTNKLGILQKLARQITHPLIDFVKHEIINPYYKFADCAYSEESAEELQEWTAFLISKYTEELDKISSNTSSDTDIEVYEAKEMEYNVDEIEEKSIKKIQQYIHKNIDYSFSVDEMKYNLQRFIIPGVMNAIIKDKLSLVESWLDYRAFETLQNFIIMAKAESLSAAEILHIVDIMDPIEFRQNSKYILRFGFSLVYRFADEKGKKRWIRDNSAAIYMTPDATSYPHSTLMWKVCDATSIAVLLLNKDAQMD